MWFVEGAKDVASFYISLFGKGSAMVWKQLLRNTRSGEYEVVLFDLCGFKLLAFSGGPYFKMNPSISFIARCKTTEEVERVWKGLSSKGNIIMPLKKHLAGIKFGQVRDRFGITWQVVQIESREEEWPKIVPALQFCGKQHGNAKAAGDHYLSVFKDSKRGRLEQYKMPEHHPGSDPVIYSDFRLENVWIAAIDSGFHIHSKFNEAVSFIIRCDTQEEIDYYWKNLSVLPEAEYRGWLKDRFGVSWQILPVRLEEMVLRGTPKQREHVANALGLMKKVDIAELEKVYKENE